VVEEDAMAAVTVSNVAELSARYLLSLVRAVRDGEHLWRLELPAGPWVRTVVRLVGFVLAGIGLLLGLGVVWTQLARALPLAALLHHPRALRSMLLTGAGLGLLLVGRLSLRKGGGPVTRQ
jgi:hypothetical protein